MLSYATGKGTFFIKWFWESWISTCESMKWEKLTQNQDLNVKPKTIKLLEENIREKPHDIGFGNLFGYNTKSTD
jgi:hypothetical protein